MAAAREAGRFYVYAIMDGATCLYVGKGCGNRHKASARKHGGQPKILARFNKEAEAFDAEVQYIAELMPQNNVASGGYGGRATPVSRFDIPKALVGIVSKAEWRRGLLEADAEAAAIARLGSRRYAAISLCQRLDESNCERWGVSKLDLFRLREVANGCGA
jgi:hypothetical protein